MMKNIIKQITSNFIGFMLVTLAMGCMVGGCEAVNMPVVLTGPDTGVETTPDTSTATVADASMELDAGSIEADSGELDAGTATATPDAGMMADGGGEMDAGSMGGVDATRSDSGHTGPWDHTMCGVSPLGCTQEVPPRLVYTRATPELLELSFTTLNPTTPWVAFGRRVFSPTASVAPTAMDLADSRLVYPLTGIAVHRIPFESTEAHHRELGSGLTCYNRCGCRVQAEFIQAHAWRCGLDSATPVGN